jgi:hypothetical protein
LREEQVVTVAGGIAVTAASGKWIGSNGYKGGKDNVLPQRSSFFLTGTNESSAAANPNSVEGLALAESLSHVIICIQ